MVNMLCCPEDTKCRRRCTGTPQLCGDCEVPVCSYCARFVLSEEPSLPPAALSNDLMVFYAPEELYADGGLTVMEMICASPCITAMVCFSIKFNSK